MADLPAKGTFKIQTIGPMKSGTSKKGNKWRTFDLQFEGDPTWYNTFWMAQEDPKEGQELTGTKSYDDEFQTYKFETERQGGKSNWNPAAANATVMLASVEVVNGFLVIPAHYELWAASDDEEKAAKLKKLFAKYLATVEAASKQIKERTVSMGSLTPQAATETKSGNQGGDPGPTPPPDAGDWPGNEETPVDV